MVWRGLLGWVVSLDLLGFDDLVVLVVWFELFSWFGLICDCLCWGWFDGLGFVG